MTLRKQPELLAPAGSPAALHAALLCGADAVYLGVETLNARRSAENFTLETLPETVRQCHIRNAKLYLTLNILLFDSEFEELARVAQVACAAGVDAVIVQDLGVASALHRAAPLLRLHASTQMAVHNIEGVRVLERLGFSRVVLARECARQEIEAIARETTLEVEMFVHGAQCVCVSGQCYLSATLGQRSGNRGLCAQPCRLPFSAGETDHALSLRDMSLVSHLREIAEAGVCSLKIEGRMKRPEYVAAAVTACRIALAGGSPDLESLQAVFSRNGFTDSYYSGQRDRTLYGVRAKEDVTAAAGVLGKLENLYTDPRQQCQRVRVDFSLVMQAGSPAKLVAVDCDGNRVEVFGETPQSALQKPTDPERARAAIAKTGGTPYLVGEIDCAIGAGLMLPASAMNALRREALAQLDLRRGLPRTISCDPAAFALPEAMPRQVVTPAVRVLAARVGQFSARMWQEAALLILPVEELERLCAKEALPAEIEKLCVGLPRIRFAQEDKLEQRLQALRKAGVCHAQADNLGSLELARQAGFLVHIGPFFNLLNSRAAEVAAALGAQDLTVSPELTLEGMRRLRCSLPRGVLAYGHLPLMVFRACPVRLVVGCEACRAGKAPLVDRMGCAFRTDCTWGAAELLNPQPLYMADRREELADADFYLLRFGLEADAQCARVFDLYLDGSDERPEAFTRGLLYKTVR